MPKNKFLQDLKRAVGEIGRLLFSEMKEERSTSISSLYEQVFSKSMESDEWMWLVDLFVEESTGQIFAIFTKEGLLYRSPVTVSESGISIGLLTQVQQYFRETVKSRMLIKREEGKPTRWFLQAASTVINRNGAIDSSQLLDNMIRRCEESGKYPFLTFFHLGEVMRMGMTDWLSRSDNILIASGLFDDNEIAQCMVRSCADNPGYWGSSISFFAYDFVMEEIARDIKVPIYTDGELHEISVLPEKSACSLFTALHSESAVERKVIMRTDIEEAIRKLTGDDSALADKLIAAVDESNGEISKRGLIAREVDPPAEEASDPEVEASVVETPAVETQERVVEIDESLLTELVSRTLSSPMIAEHIESINTRMTSMETRIAELAETISRSSDATTLEVRALTERVSAVSASDEQKRAQWTEDLPRNKAKTTITRARDQGKDPAKADKPTADEIAAETLSKIV